MLLSASSLLEFFFQGTCSVSGGFRDLSVQEAEISELLARSSPWKSLSMHFSYLESREEDTMHLGERFSDYSNLS